MERVYFVKYHRKNGIVDLLQNIPFQIIAVESFRLTGYHRKKLTGLQTDKLYGKKNCGGKLPFGAIPPQNCNRGKIDKF
ncbi:MAG: hypothetical protein J5795_08300 [Lachnospiraceae bacterium]|nr:hypothetical protein [Lachnospiraceae bacterium]MBO4788498.1 hypothetical protein [Lachnospiraceae bacterium]